MIHAKLQLVFNNIEVHWTYPTDLRCSSHEISNFNSTAKLSSKLETTAQNTSFPLRISLANINKPEVSSGFVHIYYRNP